MCLKFKFKVVQKTQAILNGTNDLFYFAPKCRSISIEMKNEKKMGGQNIYFSVITVLRELLGQFFTFFGTVSVLQLVSKAFDQNQS